MLDLDLERCTARLSFSPRPPLLASWLPLLAASPSPVNLTLWLGVRGTTAGFSPDVLPFPKAIASGECLLEEEPSLLNSPWSPWLEPCLLCPG
eukprot:scaffold27234_cov22-Tisochrysis_lutea.AAC.2